MIKTFFQTAFMANWETTLVGFLGAITFVVYPILMQNRWPTELEWALALFSAIKGLVTKDHNKVGTGAPGDPIRSTPYVVPPFGGR